MGGNSEISRVIVTRTRQGQLPTRCEIIARAGNHVEQEFAVIDRPCDRTKHVHIWFAGLIGGVADVAELGNDPEARLVSAHP